MVLSLVAVLWHAECGGATFPSGNGFVHIQACPDRVPIYSTAKPLVEGIGYVCSASLTGAVNLRDVQTAGSFGALLLWASHGGSQNVRVEQCYSSLVAANGRKGDLEATAFRPGDLCCGFESAVDMYFVGLTNAGIKNTFSGDIACVAACNSATTAGNWADHEIGYEGTAYGGTSQTDMTAVFNSLTAVETYDAMTVASALSGSQILMNGDGNIALLPWIIGYTPEDYFIYDQYIKVNVMFGGPMSSVNFSVTGNAIKSDQGGSLGNWWVKVQTGWEQGEVSVKIAANQAQSSSGIGLKEEWKADYNCATDEYPNPNIHGSTWGVIKSAFGVCCALDGAQALSSDDNIVVWSEFGGGGAHYCILRRIDGEETMSHIGTNQLGDTVYIDEDVAAGHMYHYRVISDNGDTLEYTNECSAGLTMVSETVQMDDGGWLYAPTTDGDYIYAAYHAIPQVIKKIDIADPLNPVFVASRSIPSDYFSIEAMEIVYYDAYLLCMTADCLLMLSKQDDMPLISDIALPFAPRSGCNDMCIIGNTAFVARGDSGLTAINFSYPDNMRNYGTYYGPEGEGITSIWNIEAIGDYLYILGERADYTPYSEIVKPHINEPRHTCSFNQICSDIEQPGCTDPPMRLVFEVMAGCIPGSPAGFYTLGQIGDDEFAVINTADQTAPDLLKAIQNPLDLWCWPNGWCYPELESYTFDDRYLYLMGRRDGDAFNRTLFVYDITSDETVPVYVTGDTMDVADVAPRGVVSWGSYLYCFDRVISVDMVDHYNRLRVYEKARGCDADMEVFVSLDPPVSTYKLGQTMHISWNGDGCPYRLHIKLAGDIPNPWTIAPLTTLTYGDLSAGTYDWVVEGLDPDYEDHTYYVTVEAWNFEGKYVCAFSPQFQIVEDFPPGKGGGTVPILGFIAEDGNDRTYPLPGLYDETVVGDCEHWVFPANPRLYEGELSFSIRGCEGKGLCFDLLQLYAIDMHSARAATAINAEEDGMNNGDEYERVRGILKDALVAKGQRTEKDDRQDTDLVHACAEHGPFELCGDVSIDITCEVPGCIDGMQRFYVLSYSGVLGDGGDARSGDVPDALRLLPPYPNPFNPTTTIEYHVPHAGPVSLNIYDAAGRLVRCLREGAHSPRVYRVIWDGMNDRGEPVASGVYFLALASSRGEKINRKLIFLR